MMSGTILRVVRPTRCQRESSGPARSLNFSDEAGERTWWRRRSRCLALPRTRARGYLAGKSLTRKRGACAENARYVRFASK